MEGVITRVRSIRNNTLARLLVFLAILGPGIVTASVDNDAGGIATYSLAGARFGYSLLWSLIPITISLIVVQEMCARMGAVTGKGLADLIRERYGVRVTTLLMIAVLLTNFSNTMAEFAGLAEGGEIFGISRLIMVPAGALFVWVLLLKGNYKSVERVFLVACTFYLSYIISGFLADPPWDEIARAVVTPSLSLRTDYLVMLIGMVGTTTAPWMQFYMQSAVVEKGITAKDYPYSRADTIIGCIVTGLVAFFIIIACAAALYANKVPIETAKDAAIALGPLAGKYASGLFAFGLINASLFAACILPLSTSYSVCQALGFESGVSRTFKEAPVFFTLYTLHLVIAAIVVLFPQAPLLHIMFFSQVANGILLPLVLIFMLQLVNSKELMGQHVNSRGLNIIAWLTTVIMIGLTLIMLATQISSLISAWLVV